jgi:type VI secretion system protein VasJ
MRGRGTENGVKEPSLDLELLGKEPISSENPTGVDVRYEPVYDDLQVEIRKFSSISGPASIKWEEVIKLSSEILAQKSKDLTVASWLAVALIHVRQMEGLAIGLRVYQDLLEKYWDNLYPVKTRMSARISAIEWWLEKTEGALDKLQPKPLPADQMKSIKEIVEKIDQFLSQNLKDLEEPINLNGILKRLKSPPPEESKEETPTPGQKAAPKEKEPEISETIASAKEAQRVLNFGLQKIREATSFLWQENLSNPMAYRWTRILAWSGAETLPPATDGKTRIQSPPPAIKESLSKLRSNGDHQGLIKTAEAKIPQFIFWIDLNFLVSEALGNLGENYQRAKEVVDQETAFFLHRLKGIEELCFSDGTPFADPEAKQWLKGVVLRGGSMEEPSPPVSGPLSTAQEKEGIEKEVREAQVLIKKGKVLDAVERLQQKFHGSLSHKEKFLWRLALCQLLVNTKQSKLILPHLEQVLKDIDLYRLEEYDPELALRALKVIWFGWSAQSHQASKEKTVEMLDRIAKLDLTEAIRMGKT